MPPSFHGPAPQKLLLLASTLAAIIAAVLFFTRNTEPRYEGKPLSYWVRMYAPTNFMDAVPRSSDEPIRQIGTNAIPYLLKWISEATYGTKMIEVINIPIQWLNDKLAPKSDWTLEDTSWYRQAGASRAFVALGSQAQPAIPELERLLDGTKGEAAEFLAALALGNLGQLGVLPLTKAITNANIKIRIAASRGIGYLGTNAEPLIPILIHNFDDKEEQIQEFAYLDLMELKLRPDLVVPAMIARVESENPTARIRAAAILSKYRTLASPAIPGLLRALNKTNNSTNVAERNAILEAIRRIDRQAFTNVTQSLTNAQSGIDAPPR